MHVRDDNNDKNLDLETYTTCPQLAGWYGLNSMDLSKYIASPAYENWETFMHGGPNDLQNTNLASLIASGTNLTTS